MRRRSPLNAVITILIATTMSLPVPARAQAPASAAVLEPADSAALRAATAIARAAPALSRIWPGYWAEGKAFAVLRPPEVVLLVTAAQAPAGYQRLETAAVAPELRGRLYLHRGPLPNVDENTFGTRVVVGSDSVWAVAPMGPDTDPFRQLSFYFHEHFHLAHQRGGGFVEVPEDRRTATFRQPLVDPAHLTEEFGVAAELERRMLVAALAERDADSLRTVVRQYLAVRRERAGTLLDVVEVERRMERMEGTAMYVGCRAAAAAMGAPEESAVACILAELEVDLATQRGNMPEADARLMRWRLYGTGGAITLLLDRLRPGWKELVDQGMHLDQLLAQAVDYDPTRTEEWAAAGRQRSGGM